MDRLLNLLTLVILVFLTLNLRLPGQEVQGSLPDFDALFLQDQTEQTDFLALDSYIGNLLLFSSQTSHGNPIVPHLNNAEVWENAAPWVTIYPKSRGPNALQPALLRSDGTKRSIQSKVTGDWGAYSSNLEFRERESTQLDPLGANSWTTGEKLNLPVSESIFAFAQLDASSPTVEMQQHRWLGKYGVGFKMKPWLLEDLRVRGGPALRYDDTGKTPRGNPQERAELFVEASTKVPLPTVGPLAVEWTSYAIRPQSAADRNIINQDFRLGKPLGRGNELFMGAKYRWDDQASPSTWLERAQLYLGLQIKR